MRVCSKIGLFESSNLQRRKIQSWALYRTIKLVRYEMPSIFD